MSGNSPRGRKMVLLAGLLASSIVIPAALTHAAQGKGNPGGAPSASSSPVPSPASGSSISQDTRSPRAAMMYRRIWGVDNMKAQETASGSMIRFSYRVVDATKAKALNDDKQTPYLIDASTGAKMGIPHTEKIGKLRQVATPKNGRDYWMVFSNRGRFVKPGNRVSVVIGKFRADGLVVESSQSARATQKP